MTLYDLHVHSNYSYDIRDGFSLRERAQFAKKAGLSGIAITDHFDFFPDGYFYFRENLNNEGFIDPITIENRRKEILSVKSEFSASGFDVLYGVELGGQIFSDFNVIDKYLALYSDDLDIVLGSVHIIHSGFQFSSKESFDNATDEEIKKHFSIYLDDLLFHSKYGVGEVFTHCNYAERYLYRYGRHENIDYSELDDLYIEVFKNLIRRGIALEINTSGYNIGNKRLLLPDARLVSIYKNLGGELVTIGTDAHTI